MFYEQLFKKLLFIIYWNEVWKKTSICSVWWIFHDTTEFFNWIFFSVMADWSQLNTVPPSPAFALLSISTWYRKTLQSLKSFFWVKVLDLHKATVNDIHNIINSYTTKIKNNEISDEVWVHNIMNSNTCTTKINNKIRDKAKIFHLLYIKSFKESYMYNKFSDKALKAQKRNCI